LSEARMVSPGTPCALLSSPAPGGLTTTGDHVLRRNLDGTVR
jgi:hypothetical protein